MDKDRKKQLILEYKNRKPEMGVMALKCLPTGDVFLGTTTDLKAGSNSITVKLESHWHPNKTLLALWDQYGKEQFEIAMYEQLEYDKDGIRTDYSEELELLLKQCLDEDEKTKRIW